MSQQAAPPPWWDDGMCDLINRRAPMPNPERWQTTYVRYKCQPEATPGASWRLQASRAYADRLAHQEGVAVAPGESLLYDGLAPRSLSLSIVEAPAEYCVPVKQDRRLTPNFRVRAEVEFRGRCRFPLTIKAYVIAQPQARQQQQRPQAGAGSSASAAAAAATTTTTTTNGAWQAELLKGWIPDDFCEQIPGVPRRPITELKGTVCVSHMFEGQAATTTTGGGGSAGGSAGGAEEHARARAEAEAAARAAQARLRASVAAADPAMGALLQHAQGPAGELDAPTLERLLGPGAASAVGGATSAVQLAVMLSKALAPCNPPLAEQVARAAADAAAAAEAAADAAAGPLGTLWRDFEFSNVEFLKPTRMGKAVMAFACSVLEQDLMFVAWHVPTVGICRAEQRAKACARLGLVYGEPTGPPTALEHAYALPSGPEERAWLAAMIAGASGAGAGAGGGAAAPTATTGQAGGGAGGGGGGSSSPSAAGAVRVRSAPAAARTVLPPAAAAALPDAQQQQQPLRQLSAGGELGLSGGGAAADADDAAAAPAPAPAAPAPAAAAAENNHHIGPINNNSGGGVGSPRGQKRAPVEDAGEASADVLGSHGGACRRPALEAGGGGGAAPSTADDDHPQQQQQQQQQEEEEYRTRGALRRLVLDEYAAAAALSRRLAPADLAALEALAGFSGPPSPFRPPALPPARWDAFVARYRALLRLLRRVAGVWNMEDPCLIAGLDVGRAEAGRLLSAEPEGTFLCRLSLTPGQEEEGGGGGGGGEEDEKDEGPSLRLAMTCKVAPGAGDGGGDLVHAVLLRGGGEGGGDGGGNDGRDGDGAPAGEGSSAALLLRGLGSDGRATHALDVRAAGGDGEDGVGGAVRRRVEKGRVVAAAAAAAGGGGAA